MATYGNDYDSNDAVANELGMRKQVRHCYIPYMPYSKSISGEYVCQLHVCVH